MRWWRQDKLKGKLELLKGHWTPQRPPVPGTGTIDTIQYIANFFRFPLHVGGNPQSPAPDRIATAHLSSKNHHHYHHHYKSDQLAFHLAAVSRNVAAKADLCPNCESVSLVAGHKCVVSAVAADVAAAIVPLLLLQNLLNNLVRTAVHRVGTPLLLLNLVAIRIAS
eukprot:SAG31_NODE_17564_length_666_cov_1.211640_2_plen_166_part_00